MKKTAFYITIAVAVLFSCPMNESKAQPALLNSFMVEHSGFNNAVSLSNTTIFCLVSMSPDKYFSSGIEREWLSASAIPEALVNLPSPTNTTYQVNFKFFETGVSPPLS